MSDASRGKRKRSPIAEVSDTRTTSRARLDDGNDTSRWEPQSHRSFPVIPTQPHGEGYIPSSSERHIQQDGGHQRISNLRTSMEMESPIEEHGGPSSVPIYQNHNPRHPTSLHYTHSELSLAHSSSQSGYPAPNGHHPEHHPEQHHNHHPLHHPQISLNLNLTDGQPPTIDGLPFSGYDFLGDDIFALMGNVLAKPTTAEPSAQMFEENAQVLWQAYQRPSVFGSNGTQTG